MDGSLRMEAIVTESETTNNKSWDGWYGKRGGSFCMRGEGKLIIKIVALEPDSHRRNQVEDTSVNSMWRSTEAADVKGVAFLSCSSPPTSHKSQTILEDMDLKKPTMGWTSVASSFRPGNYSAYSLLLAWCGSGVNICVPLTLANPASSWPAAAGFAQ